MAYNKVLNNDVRTFKYLSKDFSSYKKNLLEFAENYFPEHFNDFDAGNPSMMFLEMIAYVGDVLSFYTDTQIQETFLMLARDRNSIFNIAYAMGYKPKITSAASVNLDITQLVPSKLNESDEYIPDYEYAVNLRATSTFKSTENVDFTLVNDCNFQFSSSLSPTSSSIYQYNASGLPEYYLLKKQATAISAETRVQEFSVGIKEPYKTLTLFDQNIISIESCFDSEGNQWYEVPYLAQDTVFESVANTAANDPTLPQYNNQTPYLLKTLTVPKRFISRLKPDGKMELQFGSGTSDQSDELIIPNPDNIGLGIKDGRSKLDLFFDPSNFLQTKAYGEAPSNTVLTITYLVGGGLRSNVKSNTITERGTLIMDTKPSSNISQGLLGFIKSTVTSTNIEAAKGGGSGDSIEDIRLNTIANFSTQGRVVTKEDYIIRTLSLPPKFGTVAKAYILPDDQIAPIQSSYATAPNRIPNPLAHNLYTLGFDNNNKLTTLNTATKQNLATYLDTFRTMTDAINIKDAFVINFKIDFEITVFKNSNNNMVIVDCINVLRDYFHIDKWQINQPIIISDVMNVIGSVPGVQTVESVHFENLRGTNSGYSQYAYDFTSANRQGIIYPSLDPSIFELKYPNKDIKGRVTTY